jgi:hypothetical protein
MWVIAYSNEHHGWVIFDINTQQIVASAHDTHEDAVRAVETMAYRVRQGWEISAAEITVAGLVEYLTELEKQT